jgi:hypothetical protein
LFVAVVVIVGGAILLLQNDTDERVIGAILIATGLYLCWFGCSQHWTVSSNGIRWDRWFRGSQEVAWNEVDSIVDGESHLRLRSSWRGAEVSINRSLPAFSQIRQAIEANVDWDKLLRIAQPAELPAYFYAGAIGLVGWVGGILGIVAAGIAVAVQAEWLIAALLFFAAALIAGFTQFRFEVHSDRFVVRRLIWPRTMHVEDVRELDVGSTIHAETNTGLEIATTAENRFIVETNDRRQVHFVPKGGAHALFHCALAAFKAWHKTPRKD